MIYFDKDAIAVNKNVCCRKEKEKCATRKRQRCQIAQRYRRCQFFSGRLPGSAVRRTANLFHLRNKCGPVEALYARPERTATLHPFIYMWTNNASRVIGAEEMWNESSWLYVRYIWWFPFISFTLYDDTRSYFWKPSINDPFSFFYCRRDSSGFIITGRASRYQSMILLPILPACRLRHPQLQWLSYIYFFFVQHYLKFTALRYDPGGNNMLLHQDPHTRARRLVRSDPPPARQRLCLPPHHHHVVLPAPFSFVIATLMNYIRRTPSPRDFQQCARWHDLATAG